VANKRVFSEFSVLSMCRREDGRLFQCRGPASLELCRRVVIGVLGTGSRWWLMTLSLVDGVQKWMSTASNEDLLRERRAKIYCLVAEVAVQSNVDFTSSRLKSPVTNRMTPIDSHTSSLRRPRRGLRVYTVCYVD